jgi:DNA processing protein
MDDEKLYQVALSMIPGIGDVISKTLVSYCGSAKEVFRKKKPQLTKIPGLGTYHADKILAFNKFSAAEDEIELCRKHEVNLLFFTDKKYPKKLKHAPDSPTLLYHKGSADLNNPKTVAIVGTRKSTTYGRDFTEMIVERLAAHNALIVSGLAYGIDITAHKAALRNKLDTVGVMGSGMDIIYPSAHRHTALDMLEHGGLLTEIRMGAQPDRHNFPSRNRIIAGMSDVIIVIEAAVRGGAIITAEIGNSYNRDVFALPGNVENKRSQGCNNLIKQNKAHLLTGIEDIEYIMNWQTPEGGTVSQEKYYDFTQLSEDERSVVETLTLSKDGLVIDELSWKAQIPLNKLASLLLNLELTGIVKPLPGKKYRLK